MRVLIVIKRFSGTIGKDAILDNFGREIRIAEALKKKHKVTIIAGDHAKKESFSKDMNGIKAVVAPFSISGIPEFIGRVKEHARQNDIVIGTTHPIFAMMAYLGRCKRKFVYDLRDNYETYDFANVPLLKGGLLGRFVMRRVNNFLIRKADLAVCVSHSLMEKVSRLRKGKKTMVVENGVEKLFRPLSKASCRKALRLPAKAKIITYIGHVSKERGTDLLIRAFLKIRAREKKAILLLSGKVDSEIRINKPGIKWMALPKRIEVVKAINAADVAVLPQPLNETSKYTFPYKLMEYMACNTPVVATAIGDVRRVLAERKHGLANPNPDDLRVKILKSLKIRGENYNNITKKYEWENLGEKYSLALEMIR
ncbi:glycosyltransferase [Candidatus Woesearchaeota archaeon]|nr:glycosyltransferase [Candidatus Woesearchaeota archaeon]